MTDATRPWQPLSEREDEVLQPFFQGKSTTQIAEELTVSRNTIYTHANRAMRKLHARTRAEALAVWRKYAAPRP
ncbi:helix-turn-helix domain-containing protein [Bifidobacterium bifidum]|uniref:helix-turn-helix domain-containing protein n=1 Tax=Bifidobacterium bifidum TaxID=1681 RepID=UPI003D079E3A